ncbi:MAG: SRPBCC family protein [Egibacteraceae bacterium]
MSIPEYEHPTARVVRVEMEVPGTPEEVWRAIATGPGIATWFVPAEVDEHEGGTIVTHHGPWGDSVGTVTAWEPPHRFAYEERDYTDKLGAPPWATEILVEARSGTCVVRLISGFFRDSEGWEDQLEGTDQGWRQGMTNLRLYLTHFAGQPAANLFAVGQVPGERSEVSAALLGALGLNGVAPGDHLRASGDAPALEGIAEEAKEHGVLVRTIQPSPGLFELSAQSYGGVIVVVRGYLYGEGGADVAEREEARWQAWLEKRFPELSAPG